MRGLLTFALILVVIFFGVGEWRGWLLGLPSQTPFLVYKMTTVHTQERRARTASEFTFSLEGRLRRGRLVVEGSYERPGSFQTPGQQAQPERIVFRDEFHAGDPVQVNQRMSQGSGIYRVRMRFDDATGTFRLQLPPGHQL